MAVCLTVDDRGHEPRLAQLLPEALKREGVKGATVEVARLEVGDVTWHANPRGTRYFIERKAFTPATADFAQSFYNGRLARQCRAMQAGGCAAVLVEGRWAVGRGGRLYDPETGLMLQAGSKRPLTEAQVHAIMLRLQFEGIVAWATEDLEQTAWAVAKLVWMSLSPSRWL